VEIYVRGVDESDKPQVDRSSPVYVYVQIADRIEAQIHSGRLPAGAMLPGERDLMDEYKVALHTARRAVKELRDRGLVITVRAKGTFVVEPADPAETTQTE
jgi:DNA-binding GntR family transcriptional regulator